MFIQAIFWLRGKGAVMLAGYNTMPKEEKAKYNERALLKFAGIMMFPMNAFLSGMIFCMAFGHNWIALGLGAAFMATVLFMVFWVNFSDKFKRKDLPPQPSL